MANALVQFQILSQLEPIIYRDEAGLIDTDPTND